MSRGSCLGLMAVSACLVATAACGGGEEAAQQAQAQAPAYAPEATVKDLMLGLIDPSADVVWFAVKSETTREGRVIDTAPKNEEEWQAARRGALMLAEGANLLMMPGRHVARPGEASDVPGVELEPAEMERNINANPDVWNAYAQAMREASLAVLGAIDARAPEKVFDLGDEIDQACENCHTHYWYPNEKIPEFPKNPPPHP
jgi:hypothetical protein